VTKTSYLLRKLINFCFVQVVGYIFCLTTIIHMDPIRITIKPPSFISLNTIGSGIYEDAINTPRNRRKATSTTFLTQTNANIIMYEAEIKEKHEELNQYI